MWRTSSTQRLSRLVIISLINKVLIRGLLSGAWSVGPENCNNFGGVLYAVLFVDHLEILNYIM